MYIVVNCKTCAVLRFRRNSNDTILTVCGKAAPAGKMIYRSIDQVPDGAKRREHCFKIQKGIPT